MLAVDYRKMNRSRRTANSGNAAGSVRTLRDQRWEINIRETRLSSGRLAEGVPHGFAGEARTRTDRARRRSCRPATGKTLGDTHWQTPCRSGEMPSRPGGAGDGADARLPATSPLRPQDSHKGFLGVATLPSRFSRRLPAACFSKSLRLRVTSPHPAASDTCGIWHRNHIRGWVSCPPFVAAHPSRHRRLPARRSLPPPGCPSRLLEARR